MPLPLWNERGTSSLVELMIACAITAVTLGAAYAILDSNTTVYRVQDQKVEMDRTARALMSIVTRDLRMAGYQPVQGVAFDGVVYHPAQLQIRADLNGNGTVAETNEDVIYVFDAANLQVLRNTPGNQLVFPHVENFTFTYLKQDGSAAATSADIRAVQATVTARTPQPERSYNQNQGFRTVTLRSRVTPKNLAL
ncbi:MAG: PilW family protein [Nitrospirales bacterium]